MTGQLTKPHSIFYEYGGDRGIPDPPDCLADLLLDHILDAIAADDVSGDLRRMFYARARNTDEVAYRQRVFRDLACDQTRLSIETFTRAVATVRDHLGRATKLWHPLQRQGWFLQAIDVYCRAVERLRDELSSADLNSSGLREFRCYLYDYTDSPEFLSLRNETESISAAMQQIRYTVHITGLHVHVDHYRDEPDYSAQLARVFDRFRHEAAKDYHVRIPDYPDMNHVEEQILDRVARQHPDRFQRLSAHCARYTNFVDPTLDRFANEIRFYLSYLHFIEQFIDAGLPFCYPTVTPTFRGIYAEDAFDLALAAKQRSEGDSPVQNDFRLTGRERILVITGPNQGGKTTFARTVGQLAYLAALGCPVPASSATLMLPDRIFTHFERQEHLTHLHGKLDDELLRIHEILASATNCSMIIMNESFSSTTIVDALQISTEVIHRIAATDCVALCVSFLDELADLDPSCVSMVGGVSPDDPTERTFRFTRRPADGLAYAIALADKYGLSPEILLRRVAR